MLVTGIKATSLKSNMNFGATYTRADRQRIANRMVEAAALRDGWLDLGKIKEANNLENQLNELIRIFTNLIYYPKVYGKDSLFQ